MQRKHIEQAETETRAEPQQFSYRIPLAYHEAGCKLKLVNVDLLAFATYGPRDSEFGRDGGSLGVYDNLPESVPHFSTSGVRELRGKCMWLFRVIGKSNRLRKILACHKADEHWQVPQDYDQRSGVSASLRRDELDGKTVRVEFQQSEEELPFYDGTWLETESGWKPCIETDKYARIENTYCGPALITFLEIYEGAEDWYLALQVRKNYALSITALQVAAEQTLRRSSEQPSPSPARAAREKAEFYRVEVRDMVEVVSHLPPASTILAPRPSAVLASNGAESAEFGVALLPNRHHVLEVKALRAWRPLLSLTPEFSALDAYQLALFTYLAYADFGQILKPGQEQPGYPQPGSIGHVLNARLADIQTGALNNEPGQFHTVASYYPLLEEVPYSKRLEVVPHDPERYQQKEEKLPWELHSLNHVGTNTQAYISHDDRMILIGVRGTQELCADLLRDIDAAQVRYKEGVGQAHQGFYDAFQAVKEFVEPYLFNFFIDQKIVVCGHSLGGAIALLLAEWIRRDERRRPEVLLYTYGAPRAGDRTFVEGAAALVHHRIVNHNDPIPSVPTTWMDTDNRLLVPGTVALIGGASGPGALAFLAGITNLKGDPYQHHGNQHHFLPLAIGTHEETSVLWQPDCSGIEDAGCAYYAAKAGADMPGRASFIKQFASIGEHFMTSYIPACHATLLRWKAACESATNTYLSPREAHWLEQEVAQYRKNLETWERNARQRYEAMGSSNRIGSDVQRRRELERALQRVQSEKDRLPTTLGRIDQLSRQPIDMAALYGAQTGNPLLASLVSRWLQHRRNQPSQTPLHARLPKGYEATYV